VKPDGEPKQERKSRSHCSTNRDFLSRFLTALECAGDVEVPENLAEEMLQAADQYMLDRLKQLCETQLEGNLSVDTLQHMVELGEGFNALQLSRKCVLFALANFLELSQVQTPSLPPPLLLLPLAELCIWASCVLCLQANFFSQKYYPSPHTSVPRVERGGVMKRLNKCTFCTFLIQLLSNVITTFLHNLYKFLTRAKQELCTSEMAPPPPLLKVHPASGEIGREAPVPL